MARHLIGIFFIVILSFLLKNSSYISSILPKLASNPIEQSQSKTMNNIINNINNNNNALEAIYFHELFGPIGIGFGTAGIRGHTTTVIEMAIENGFRKFDTAEENMHWYDQSAVGMTLELMFAESFEEIKSNLLKENMEDEKVDLMTNLKSYFSPSSVSFSV